FLQAARRKYVAYAVFTLCAGLYVLPFMRLLLRGTDEGFLIDGAVRIVHGQVFARDFFEVVGPGTFYWLALFFRLFGVTFLATRICLYLSTLGTALLMYFLARRICRGYQVLPCLLLFSTSFGMLWPAISHHTDSNFFALLAVACMVLWLDRRRDAFLVAAGALAAATTCFLQPKGILLFAAILAWLWLQHRRASAPLSSVGLVAAGYAGVGALVLFYFWSRGALRDLVYANALWPFRHYDGVSAVPYGRGILLYYWDHWATAAHELNWTVAMASVLIVPFLFVAAIPVMLPVLGLAGAAEFRHRARLDQPVIWLYLLCGCALWLSEIHRKDICHLVYGSPLLIVLCVYFLAIRSGKPPRLALQLLSICAACLAAFNFFMVLVARPVPT
ncbi:MAG TPA: glycosyltransferase family 39 protein, partial [Rhizomicrobium sp.]